MNYALGVFLGCANIVTGIGTYAMLAYLKIGYERASTIHVELWDRSSPLLTNFLNLSESTTRGVALIACLGIINASVSQFNLAAPVYLFSGFGVVSVVLVYTLPTIPIVQKLREIKREQLAALSYEIQKEYDNILLEHYSSKRFNSLNLENMLRVYKDIVSIRTFPPVGERAVNTALIITVLTVLPSLADIVIRNFG